MASQQCDNIALVSVHLSVCLFTYLGPRPEDNEVKMTRIHGHRVKMLTTYRKKMLTTQRGIPLSALSKDPANELACLIPHFNIKWSNQLFSQSDLTKQSSKYIVFHTF